MSSAEHGSITKTIVVGGTTVSRINNHYPKPRPSSSTVPETTESRDFIKRTNRIRAAASMRPLLLQRRIDFMAYMMNSCPPIPE